MDGIPNTPPAAPDGGAAPAAQPQQINTLEGLDTFMGNMSPDDGAMLEGQPPTETAPGVPAQPNEGNQEPPQGAGEQLPPQDKANAAFAQMRVQNRQLQQQMQAQATATAELLRMLGIDESMATDPDAVMQMARDAQLQVQSEETKVPLELLQKIDSLEQITVEQQRQNQLRQATAAYQQLQQHYGLSQDQALQYATQLRSKGMDPLALTAEQLEQQFIYDNLPFILEQAKLQGMQAAQQNTAHQQQYSNTPPTSQGVPGGPASGAKITTQAQLDNFFRENFT